MKNINEDEIKKNPAKETIPTETMEKTIEVSVVVENEICKAEKAEIIINVSEKATENRKPPPPPEEVINIPAKG